MVLLTALDRKAFPRRDEGDHIPRFHSESDRHRWHPGYMNCNHQFTPSSRLILWLLLIGMLLPGWDCVARISGWSESCHLSTGRLKAMLNLI